MIIQVGDPVFCATAVDLERRFTGTTRSYPAGEARESIVLHPEPREKILQLGHLDLDLPFAGPGALSENVENELGSVHDAQLGRVGDCAHLRWIEFLVEDEQIHAALQGAEHDFAEFALPDKILGISFTLALDDRIGGDDSTGSCKFHEFVH